MARPNFVFILIDDMGWRDLGCYQSGFYETPSIDRLAAEGMTFTDAYASCPVCSPTRASVLTGRYPATVGITNYIPGAARGKLLSVPYFHALPRAEKTMAAALRENGYRTWHVGKWHLGGGESLPQKHGFDVNVGGCEWGHPHKGYFSPWQIPGLADAPAGTYLTDHLTDRAVDLIRHAAGEPFFLNMWFYSVHTPIQAKPEYVRRFADKARRTGLDQAVALVDGEHFPCEHKKEQRVRRRIIQSDPAYAAMIWSLDENVGRLLKAIDETGQAGNTVVIFTSDNGGLSSAEGSPTCNAPLAEGKGWMYDGGTREPLIVKWPGRIAAGGSCSVPVTSTDFYPTLLEMAGLDPMPEQHCDGVSILPLLAGGPALERAAIYWHYPHYSNQGGTPGCSMRMGDYKLIEFFEDGHVELYDLRRDIGEAHDLARAMPELAARMQRMLADWRASVRAKVPQRNPAWAPQAVLSAER
ncbi:MAG: sulfatase [Kiritimatiellae bacterium]|nr:sulfatase [Kiritimatiellia bacterium]